MKLIRSVLVGTLESSDLMVTLAPGEGGREIVLTSVVGGRFYDAILETVNEVLDEMEINDAYVEINDKGAMDFAIRARLIAAIKRAGGEA